MINAPISRWWPDRALTSGEIAVAFTMTLVSCCTPSSGLMRYLVPNLVVPMRQAAQKPDFLRLLETMNVPRWLWPTFRAHRRAIGATIRSSKVSLADGTAPVRRRIARG